MSFFPYLVQKRPESEDSEDETYIIITDEETEMGDNSDNDEDDGKRVASPCLFIVLGASVNGWIDSGTRINWVGLSSIWLQEIELNYV